MKFLRILKEKRDAAYAYREECRKDMEELVKQAEGIGEHCVAKVVTVSLSSVRAEPKGDLVLGSGSSSKKKKGTKAAVAEQEDKILKIKVRLKSIFDLLQKEFSTEEERETGDEEYEKKRAFLLEFVRTLTSEYTMFPEDYFFPNEKSAMMFDPLGGGSIVVSPFRARILISNFLLTRILIQKVIFILLLPPALTYIYSGLI